MKKIFSIVVMLVMISMFMTACGGNSVSDVSAGGNDYTTTDGGNDFAIESSEEYAIQTAQRYLQCGPESYESLIEALEKSGFTHEDAVKGADKCGADWNEQAVLKINKYLKDYAQSPAVIQRWMEDKKFTSEQVEYAMNSIDWNEQAIRKINSYLEDKPHTADELALMLRYDEFTEEEAAKAVAECGVNWAEQAKRDAEMIIADDINYHSVSETIEHIENNGYTHEEALYGIENADVNWNEEAAECGTYLLHYGFCNRSELAEYLQNIDGFTSEQAAYGAEHAKDKME